MADNFQGNPSILAAGVKRIAEDVVADKQTSVIKPHEDSQGNNKDIQPGTTSAFKSDPLQYEGTGAGAQGFEFSPMFDVFDPTEFTAPFNHFTVQEGTPYYPRLGDVTDTDPTTSGTPGGSDRIVTLSWSAPLVDTAARWLTTLTPSAGGTATVDEIIDSYMITRKRVEVDPKDEETLVLGIVAHAKNSVAAIREYLETTANPDSTGFLAVTDPKTQRARFDASVFYVRTYLPAAGGNTAFTVKEIRADKDLENDNRYIFVDNTAQPGIKYIYYIQAITKSQVEGLKLPIDPNYKPLDGQVSVKIFPKVLYIGKNEPAVLYGRVLGPTGGDKALTFEIQEPQGPTGASLLATPINTYYGQKTVFFAPNTTGVFHVIARAHIDSSKFDTAEIHVVDNPPVTVYAEPEDAIVQISTDQAYEGTVYGLMDKQIAWSVVEVGGGTLSAATMIDEVIHPITLVHTFVTSSVTYTAPGTANTYHIFAEAQADTNTPKANTTLAVIVTDGTGTGSPGEISFLSPFWSFTAPFTDYIPSGNVSDLEASLICGTDITKVDFYLVPIQDNFIEVEDGVDSSGIPFVTTAFYPWNVKVPTTGTLQYTVSFIGRNFEPFGSITDIQFFIPARIWESKNIEIPEELDPLFKFTGITKSAMPGSLSDYKYSVTFTVDSTALFDDDARGMSNPNGRYHYRRMRVFYKENGVNKESADTIGLIVTVDGTQIAPTEQAFLTSPGASYYAIWGKYWGTTGIPVVQLWYEVFPNALPPPTVQVFGALLDATHVTDIKIDGVSMSASRYVLGGNNISIDIRDFVPAPVDITSFAAIQLGHKKIEIIDPGAADASKLTFFINPALYDWNDPPNIVYGSQEGNPDLPTLPGGYTPPSISQEHYEMSRIAQGSSTDMIPVVEVF